MSRYIQNNQLNNIKTIITKKNQITVWYPFSGKLDRLIQFCNFNHGNFKNNMLILITNQNFQINHNKNTLKFQEKNIINRPCKINYFYDRIKYRQGSELELIEIINNNIEKYKKELNKQITGLEYKVKNWDSERIQGMLFMCNFKFEDVLDGSNTDYAFVSFQGSNVSFLILPVKKSIFYRFLINEKLKINLLISKRHYNTPNYFNNKTIYEFSLFNNILHKANSVVEYFIQENNIYWKFIDFTKKIQYKKANNK